MGLILSSGTQLQDGWSIVPAMLPDAPTITAVSAESSSTANVTFTSPVYTGTSNIISYTATSDPGGITGTLTQSGSGTISVTGLNQLVSYTFTVTSTNSAGTGVASSASSSVTLGLLAPPTVEYLVVGGGGAGGARNSGGVNGGGGGAGGYLTATGFAVTAGSALTVNVGAGGVCNGGTPSTPSTNGGDSAFSTIIALGGGAGGSTYNEPANKKERGIAPRRRAIGGHEQTQNQNFWTCTNSDAHGCANKHGVIDGGVCHGWLSVARSAER